MKVIMNYIWEEKLSSNIRAVLISNLLNIHIDTKPRTERVVPLLTKTLGSLGSPQSKRKLNHNESIFGAGMAFSNGKAMPMNVELEKCKDVNKIIKIFKIYYRIMCHSLVETFIGERVLNKLD
jgi:hypothetical protein